MATLYELIQRYNYIVSELEENGGELTSELDDEFSILQDELEDKLRAYKDVIALQEQNKQYNKDEIDRLRLRNKTFDNVITRLKKSVAEALHLYGDRTKAGNYKLSFADFSVSTRNTKSVSINEDSMNYILDSCRYQQPISSTERNLLENCKSELDECGKAIITLEVPPSLLERFCKNLNDIYGDNYDMTFKFNKSDIKKLDELALSISETDENNSKVKRISDVLNYIGFDINNNESVSYK